MNFDTVKFGDSFELIVEDAEGSYIVVIMTPVKAFMFFPKVENVFYTLRVMKFTECSKFDLLIKNMKTVSAEANATTKFLPISQTLVDSFKEVFGIDLLELTTIGEPKLEEADVTN